MATKEEIRDEKRRLRRKVAERKPFAGNDAALRLKAANPPEVRKRLFRRQVFASYHAVGSEMSAFVLERYLRFRGWRQAWPVAPTREDPLVFRELCDPAAYVPDAFNMLGPPASARTLDPDLLIVPLIAFDRRGGRIGQGGGTYDRTIANLRARKTVWVMGLAFACQEAPEVPMEPHDQRLDAILTEMEYIPVARNT